ncbi:MAG: DEAD/DEAH box helicase [Myxococcota bacterium]|nr:DEAD/DEAH box helicase [Myxococcota bacterium]
MEPETSDPNVFVDLPEDIRQGIADLGWTDPMPVQAQSIAPMRKGGDLIVQARTGSGKTGAFGIPIVAEIDTDLAAPQALVLAPTRELANQICTEVTAIGKHRGVRTLPIYGGTAYGPQLEGLAEGPHVIVGTPGRILDHLGSGRMSFDDVKMVVFDEADELLSLGFWPDMKEIRSYLPEERQSCLFSATMPEKVLALARAFLVEPEFISLVEGHSSPQEIEHFYCVTTAQEKDHTLRRLLEVEDPESAIIFCNTKDDVRFVTAFLQRHGFDADAISGDLTQAAREAAMKRIKAGELRFLVATDVAARGIDISDLSHVIGYSAPDSAEVYVHRTGRTGRAGKAGIAISLVSGLDIGNFRNLQKINKIEISERPVPTEQDILDRVQERLSVKIEQEIRQIPDREQAFKVDRFVPIVEKMAATPDGRRDLAAICASYLQEHRPETSVREEPPAKAPSQSGGREGRSGRDEGRSGGGEGEGRRGGRRPRRRRGGGGGGGRRR